MSQPSPTLRSDRLPAGSSLWGLQRPGDFIDCYSTESRLSPREAALRGLAMPAWARLLLRLRNALVRPLGLHVEAPSTETGDSIGLFPICKDGPDECVLGFDDRHLDFRIAVLCADGRAYLSTWVHPHNCWGRAYLRLIMPFHVLIVRGATRRMGVSGPDAPLLAPDP